MNYLEQTPQDLLLSLVGSITVVERDGADVKYYIDSNLPQGIYTITFASEALAQAAIDAFLLAANPPPIVPIIQVGDSVQIRLSPLTTARQTSSNTIYKVETVRDNEVPFWELSLDGALYVVDTPIILVKVDAGL